MPEILHITIAGNNHHVAAPAPVAAAPSAYPSAARTSRLPHPTAVTSARSRRPSSASHPAQGVPRAGIRDLRER